MLALACLLQYAEHHIAKVATAAGAAEAAKYWKWGRFCNAIGAVAMFALMAGRHTFVWWPLHPIGFAVGMVWITQRVWFSIFIAWLIKLLLLKYGGPRLFRKLRPFFLGLILGQFVAAGIWLVIDYVVGMTGNTVFWI